MDLLEFEKVTIADAREALEGQRKPVETTDWNRERGAAEDGVLTNATATWLAELPEGVRPNALACRFPRLANSIGSVWRRVARCEEYLEELVVDQRGGRHGFPLEVAKELTKLRLYYAELHPVVHTAWDLVEREK